MPDDNYRLPQDADYEDDDYTDDHDVPFRLPKAKGHDDSESQGNIHKDDTEDLVLPTSAVDDDADDPQETDEVARLRASDPPLDSGYPEDASLLMRQGQPDADEDDDEYEGETAPRQGPPRRDYDPDEDVPFRLPQHQGDDEQQPPVGSKFYTMPSDPNRPSAQTLPGSGGLDPNPDFAQPGATMPNQTVRSAGQGPRGDARYQRPANATVQGQPRQRQTPMAPSKQAQQDQQRKPLPRQRRRRRFNPGCVALLVGLFVTFCGGLTLLTGTAGVLAYARVGELLDEQIDRVEDYTNFQSTFIYDRDGRQLFEVFNEGRRTNVSIDQMPDALIEATISIEDDSFFRNIGVDVPATTVAFLQFVGADAGEDTAGGSTITQQLVRNVLFDPEYRAERSARRKAEEILLAVALNGRKSKDEILEMYLNEIYYGNLAYGAQAAADVFFGKDVEELTLGEAAMLAGLPQAPAELDPLNPDPEVQAAVFSRWNQVLGEMVEEGYITAAERDQAIAQGLQFNYQNIDLRAPHFTVFARGQLEQLMTEIGYSPEEIARGGLRVYTTVDLEINEMVERIARQQIQSLPPSNNVSNAAAVVVKPITGEILAMVGSIDYDSDVIDGRVNVTTALRQPGSTMKPFTYSAAMERGFTTGDVIWDTPVRIGIPGQEPYIPRNYDGRFHGPMRMREALANSYNIPAVQVLRYTGVDYLLSLLDRFGFVSLGTDASFYGVSLTLGGGEVSPLEMTRGYSVFANDGLLVDTTPILCILDNDDNILYQYEGGCPEGNLTGESVVQTALGQRVLDPRVAFVISDILADNPARTPAMGGSSALYTPNLTTSVKTGTTNDNKDNWTIGYTSNVSVGVWVGNNDGDPMIGTSGLTGAAPIWNNVITGIYNDTAMLREFAVDGQLRTDQLEAPVGISRVNMCRLTSLIDPATACPSQITEWMLDSPAGIPNGSGSLEYPPAPAQEPLPATGAYIREVDPGVYSSLVYRLAPSLAQQIQFNVDPGQRQPPPPIYCRAPAEAAGDPNVVEQLFIEPPRFPGDAAEAEAYARNNGNLAFLPTIDCTPELMTGGGGFGPSILTANIDSPQPGTTVTGPELVVTGTANFTPEQAQYFRVDIIGGDINNWTTMADVSYNPVIGGVLARLPTSNLIPGDYRVKLVIVGNDGQVVQEPFEVGFSVQPGGVQG